MTNPNPTPKAPIREPRPAGGAVPALFAGKAEGWHFTAVFERLWGTGVHRQKYTYGGVVEQHGYRKGGAWALSGGPGWEPSYRAKVRRYREKRWRWLVLGDDEIEDGWNDGANLPGDDDA